MLLEASPTASQGKAGNHSRHAGPNSRRGGFTLMSATAMAGAPLILPPSTLSERLPAEPYILFVGALAPHKGILPLLAAYRQLVSPPPLHLIGTRWPDTPNELPPGVTAFEGVPHPQVMVAW